LVSVDLQEHIADAQRHAIVASEDNLNLLHGRYLRSCGLGCRGGTRRCCDAPAAMTPIPRCVAARRCQEVVANERQDQYPIASPAGE
jgi:hypothetical protein